MYRTMTIPSTTLRSTATTAATLLHRVRRPADHGSTRRLYALVSRAPAHRSRIANVTGYLIWQSRGLGRFLLADLSPIIEPMHAAARPSHLAVGTSLASFFIPQCYAIADHVIAARLEAMDSWFHEKGCFWLVFSTQMNKVALPGFFQVTGVSCPWSIRAVV